MFIKIVNTLKISATAKYMMIGANSYGFDPKIATMIIRATVNPSPDTAVPIVNLETTSLVR